MERKILAAVDGSVPSYNALRYLSHLFTDLADISVHLFYVVPVGSLEPGMDWLDDGDRLLVLPSEARERVRRAERFMEEAVLQLGRRGIGPDQVSTEITLSRMGVAHDIINEARKGLYDAVLMGRRGLGRVEEYILGSVSLDIVRQAADVPLWVVDGKVNSRLFLLPVDRSFNSLKAADHLAFILQDNPYAAVCLVHFEAVLGGDTEPDRKELESLWGAGWCAEHLEGEDAVYAAPEALLVERGFPAERVIRLPESHSFTPHGAILKVCKGCGTVVIGRRRRAVDRVLVKRVSAKVMELAREIAVWLV